jgi:hypothetical protein
MAVDMQIAYIIGVLLVVAVVVMSFIVIRNPKVPTRPLKVLLSGIVIVSMLILLGIVFLMVLGKFPH